MEVIPAIDIMDGSVVRLTRGDPGQKTRYPQEDPIEFAKFWASQGAKRLHVIDLDAALGRGANKEVITGIAEETQIPIQVGGGIRSRVKAQDLLDRGINRIILGSLAIKDRATLQWLLEEYGADRIIVSLDHSGGTIRIRGWKEETELKLVETLKNYSEMGVKLFLVTDIERDGTLQGPDLETLSELATGGYRLIAAGGIRDVDDLKELDRIGMHAAVVGKALYEGELDLSEALFSSGDP
ncbi:MAG: 1-(5-phosphoribosyl)-5-[(5-phosphoribosylamino)methylideneamino]imidazole-4-carboxamide isomerase [Candidatus Bathyarchaeia archaeon]